MIKTKKVMLNAKIYCTKIYCRQGMTYCPYIGWYKKYIQYDDFGSSGWYRRTGECVVARRNCLLFNKRLKWKHNGNPFRLKECIKKFG